MKIDKPTETPAIAPIGGERPAPGRAAARTTPPSAESDSVSLSDRSRMLRRAGEEAAAEPAFDAAKVEAVKAAMANGTFKVDAGKIADGLIATVTDMLSRKSK